MGGHDERRQAPATGRNRDPILAVLRRILPPAGLVLEIASGTGEHAVHFARHLPGLAWQPSDPSPEARASIAAWTVSEALPNVLPPLPLDALAKPWPLARADAIICINMIHISPWEATEGLMTQAGQLLGPGGVLYLYGPFRRPPRELEPGNLAFDQDLKRRDPRWGLRTVDDVAACARANGLLPGEVVEMPANNISVVFHKH